MPNTIAGDTMDAGTVFWNQSDARSMNCPDTIKVSAGTAGADISISGKKGLHLEPLSPAGPLEHTDETPSPMSSEAEAAEFAELCHQGWAWTWANLRVKIYRFTILIIKQVYLIFMTLSMPTNHLMWQLVQNVACNRSYRSTCTHETAVDALQEPSPVISIRDLSTGLGDSEAARSAVPRETSCRPAASSARCPAAASPVGPAAAGEHVCASNSSKPSLLDRLAQIGHL
ncbi:hypothetical protein COO60DRAFT_516990 [Scenedesmus sp. NREL 46B-D3]|nr:hypothetical protein COO60DRAFT_516990 [Scenedesmus sp. NREL 46B-D3]